MFKPPTTWWQPQGTRCSVLLHIQHEGNKKDTGTSLEGAGAILKSQEQNLVTRQAQLFMQLYSQYYDKDWLEALHKTAFDMSFKDYDDFVAKYGPKEDPEAYKSFRHAIPLL